MNLIQLLGITQLDVLAFIVCSAVGIINVCRMNALEADSSWAARTGQVAMMVGATVYGLQPLVFAPFGGAHASLGGLVLAGACLVTLLTGRGRWRHGAPVDTKKPGRHSPSWRIS
jgi:hypothetical protein